MKECGYPQWSVDKVKQQMSSKHPKEKQGKKDKSETHSRGLVVIPYVEGVAEKIQHILKKYNINTSMRPTNTLKSLLVHPKDRSVPKQGHCI